jgi:large subunit ribosomal protein L18
MNLQKKRALAQKRKWRIRKKVIGSAHRPRVAVCFTNKNLHAQCIDDGNSHTLTSISSNERPQGSSAKCIWLREDWN